MQILGKVVSHVSTAKRNFSRIKLSGHEKGSMCFFDARDDLFDLNIGDTVQIQILRSPIDLPNVCTEIPVVVPEVVESI